MFCRNCGREYPSDAAVVCVSCGVKKGDGCNYCWNCGESINPGSQFCMKCGVSTRPERTTATGAKSKIVAGLLGIFLGCFGIHNFYLGYNQKATIQCVLGGVGVLLSCIGVGILLVTGIGIWGLVEGILILCGNINVDGNGNPLCD